MTDLQVRRVRFDFDGVPFRWNPANPAFSFAMNATSIIAICFEKMIVAAVHEAMPHITDPDVAAEADAFLRQEAQHASAHRQHLRALTARYPGLQQTVDDAVGRYDQLTESTPLAFRLAYVADLEATFTPSFKLMLDNEETLFRPGDDRVASLFLWHFVEEVEHRSSALIVYDTVVPSRWYRVRMLPAVVRHLGQVMSGIADGVNAHVPEADRGVDARTLLPTFGVRQALRTKLRLGGAGRLAAPAFHPVPWRQKLVAVAGVLASQTPYHNPAHQRLPEFAEEWFRRYDRGYDISHWYTSELAG